MIPAPAIKLSEADYAVIPVLIDGFRRLAETRTRITSDNIVALLRKKGYNLTDADLRRIIGFIRRHELARPGFILSGPRGYWYSEDKEEAIAVWEAQYGRALEIIQNFSPIYKRYNENTTQLKIEL